MKTVPYSEIKELAAELAGRADDTTNGLRLPPSEAALLLSFLASDIVDVWNAEAWPELCEDFETVTLSADKTFSKREGDADEMGDILSIYVTANPQTSTICTAVDDWVEADGKVRVMTDQTTLYVEYMQPAPDLLSVEEDDLDDYELPRRFKNILAFRAAAFLLAQEDPALAERYRNLGNARLLAEAGRVPIPWWRKPRMKK